MKIKVRNPWRSGTAQAFAQRAQARMRLRKLCTVLVSGALLGTGFWKCASPERALPPGGFQIDAAVKSANGWILFRFGSLQYQRVTADRDSLVAVLGNPQRWMEIASPGGNFRPVQVVMGSQGHYYLVDAGGYRICLYDTAAQLLSTFPFPASLPALAPGRMEVFRGANGDFTFVDYFAGQAWQYTDRQGDAGNSDWVMRNQTRMPMGLQDCYQEPDGLELACRVGEQPARLDAALNRIHNGAARNSHERLLWDSENREWVLEVVGANGGASGFRFWPARRLLVISAPP